MTPNLFLFYHGKKNKTHSKIQKLQAQNEALCLRAVSLHGILQARLSQATRSPSTLLSTEDWATQLFSEPVCGFSVPSHSTPGNHCDHMKLAPEVRSQSWAHQKLHRGSRASAGGGSVLQGCKETAGAPPFSAPAMCSQMPSTGLCS